MLRPEFGEEATRDSSEALERLTGALTRLLARLCVVEAVSIATESREAHRKRF